MVRLLTFLSAAVSPQDFPDRAGTYIILNDLYVLTVRPIEGFQRGAISLAEPQRSWASVSIRDVVQARRFDPFSGNAPSYVVSMDVEISFASQKKTSDQLDQDNLGATFTRVGLILSYALLSFSRHL